MADSFLTRLKTEYFQNSRSGGAPSLATSTSLLSGLLPLALVPVLALSSVLPRPVVTYQLPPPGTLDRYYPQLFWKDSSSLDVQETFSYWKFSRKSSNFRSTKNSLLSSSKPSGLETFHRSTSIMSGVSYRRVPHWCNGKSLSRDGSYTGDLVLCLGLDEACRDHMSQRCMESIYYYKVTPHIMG